MSIITFNPAERRRVSARSPSPWRGAAGLLVAAALLLSTQAAVAAPQHHATALHVAAEAGVTRVRLSFDSAPNFTARASNDGLKLIVDVPHADLKGAKRAFTEERGLVSGVLLQDFRTSKSATVRAYVSLTRKARYSAAVVGNDLILTFSEHSEPSAAAAAPRVATPVSARVLDVGYDHGAHEDRVRIELSETSPHSESTFPGVARLVLPKASLPKQLRRALDVSAFQGRIASVSSFAQGDSVVFEARLAGPVKTRILKQGPNLIWSFFKPGELPSTETGVARDGGAARRSRTVSVDDPALDIPEVIEHFTAKEAAIAPQDASGFSPAVAAQATRYSGRRIDLDLKDADIGNVLRLLADVGRVNVVASDNVKGTVTIRMRNVPWDQALDVVLQSKNLGMVRSANMLRVAPLDDLQRERDARIVKARTELALAPMATRLIPVSYAFVSQLQEKAKGLLSARGSIAVDQRTNVLIVRDVEGNIAQIEELVRSLDTQTPMVLIEARIIEATNRYLRDVGIQWGGDATFSQVTGNPTGLAFPNRLGVTGGAADAQTPTAGLSPFQRTVQNPNFAVNLPAAIGTGSGGALGLTFGSVDNNINLAVRLSAAEASGRLRIVSSPRILTMDNATARISSGTLIPFSVVSAQGVQTQFQEAKLQLLVLPHVTADGSISLAVKVNRDEPDFNQTSARGDPTILKREAETTLLVQDGHTAVIGGIYQRNSGSNIDQVPFFGDIPILGLLFQRRRTTDLRNELVIFITPRIVNRAEALGR